MTKPENPAPQALAATPAVIDRKMIETVIGEFAIDNRELSYLEMEPDEFSRRIMEKIKAKPTATPAVERATSASPCLNCGKPSDELFCGTCREMGCSIPATPAVGGEREALDAAIHLINILRVSDRDPVALRFAEQDFDATLERLAAQPASPLRGSVNDKVREIVYQMSPAEQYDLAFKVAENVGYMLVREPEHPDSPHLTASPPEQPETRQQKNEREMAEGSRCDGSCNDGMPCHCQPAPAQPAADQPSCSHPNAKVWFYRDDDTYMRCEDCGRRWCESPTSPSKEPELPKARPMGQS